MKHPSKRLVLWRLLLVYIFIAAAATFLVLSRTKTSVDNIQLSEISSTATEEDKQIVTDQPRRLVIQKIDLDLDIVIEKIDTDLKTWVVHDGVANFADGTAMPNDQSGMSFIYGHARKGMFARLGELAAGDSILIYGETGLVFKYVVNETRIVAADATEFLDETYDQPTLVLATCHGWLSQKRLLVEANFVEVGVAQ